MAAPAVTGTLPGFITLRSARRPAAPARRALSPRAAGRHAVMGPVTTTEELQRASISGLGKHRPRPAPPLH